MTVLGVIGMVVAPQPSTVPANDPVITSLSTPNWKEGATGVEINGTDFGPTQAGGSVTVSMQGRNQFDTIGIAQTIDIWTDTKITLTVTIPLSGGVKQAGYFAAQVHHNSGAKSGTTQVLIGPDQTVIGTEHASGLVLIDLAADTLQTKIDAEVSGAFAFHLINTSKEKTIAPRDDDQLIYAPTAAMDGAKGITHVTDITWNPFGAIWRITDQFQDDADLSFTPRSWHQDNNAAADVFFRLTGQGDEWACRLRRYGDATALAAAFNSSTLGANPIETHFNNKKFKNNLVWVTFSGTPDTGEAILLTGANATGGITINGVYTIIRRETGRVLIEHESDATSAVTGGGSSVVLEKGLGNWFDVTANTIEVNFDPTVAGRILYASTTAIAIDGKSAAADNVIIRGADDDNKAKIMRFACGSNEAAVNLGKAAPTSDGWTMQFLNVIRNHSNGFKITGDDHNIWDIEARYNGQCGLFSRAASGEFVDATDGRRVRVEHNNMADYNLGVVGGWKLFNSTNLNFDQMIFGRNRCPGFWPDTENTIHADGLRRFDVYENGQHGIFYEDNDSTAASAAQFIKNCLVRDNGWDSTDYNQMQPANVFLSGNLGDAVAPVIFKDSVVEIADIINSPGSGPANGVVIGTDTGLPNSEYNEVTSNRITYLGSAGAPMSGFQAFGGTSEAEVTEMKNNAVFNNNAYFLTVASSVDIFGSDVSGSSHPTKTFAEFQAEGWEAGGSATHDVSNPQVVDWQRGDMPTWVAIKDEATVDA